MSMFGDAPEEKMEYFLEENWKIENVQKITEIKENILTCGELSNQREVGTTKALKNPFAINNK